jgi:hypothetical protein
MGDLHSHQFRPVDQTWLWDEENELCCECGERLWIIFEDTQVPHRKSGGRFRRRFNYFSRVDTA